MWGLVHYQVRFYPNFSEPESAGSPAQMLLADADGDGVQSGGQVYTPVVSAAKACVALWMVSKPALERGLIPIRIRTLDKSQRFMYLLYRQ